MKRFFRIFVVMLMVAIFTGCLTCANAAGGNVGYGFMMGTADANQSVLRSPGSLNDTGSEDVLSEVPDPSRVLKDATVSVTEGVEVELGEDVYIFTTYTYEYQGSNNLLDSSDYMMYLMLLQADDIELDHIYNDVMYNEYAMIWNDHLIGFLTTDIGEWVLYLPDRIGLNSTSSGASKGSFQNDLYGITVLPGENVPDQPETAKVCESCKGSKRCSACGGDGLADSIYVGEYNAFSCDVCDHTGICTVCDGTGVW